MTQAAKKISLERLGVDCLIEIPFTGEISRLTPKEFVEKILYENLGLNHIVVGNDFKFGHRRKGTAQMLKELGNSFGANVTIAPLVRNGNLEISSTAIRQALTDGNPRKAAKMLGDWYSIVGIVSEGDKRGRTLGYPTINLDINNLHLPKFGVYSSIVEVLTGPYKGPYMSAVSIGERPTYGKHKPNLEAHLLDFSGDLYGEEVSVLLIAFQRSELPFNSSEELIMQMNIDCNITRATIQKIKPHEKTPS
jgi:riboflavin kinase/FMN adenylyltransferase